jgi:uncharacterized protein with PIN domain
MSEYDKGGTAKYETQYEKYVYVVREHTPEFMPSTATRRDKHFKASDMKIIKCPHCRSTFRAVEKAEKIELYRHSSKAKGKYHASLSCQTCRTAVGVIYASA